MSFYRNQPIFFSKLPATEKTPPNAEFLRYMGEVNGEKVVEIEKGGEKWVVRESEISDIHGALSKKALELQAKIEEARKQHPRRPDLLKALAICDSTFRRWCGLIQNHLPKTQ